MASMSASARKVPRSVATRPMPNSLAKTPPRSASRLMTLTSSPVDVAFIAPATQERAIWLAPAIPQRTFLVMQLPRDRWSDNKIFERHLKAFPLWRATHDADVDAVGKLQMTKPYRPPDV